MQIFQNKKKTVHSETNILLQSPNDMSKIIFNPLINLLFQTEHKLFHIQISDKEFHIQTKDKQSHIQIEDKEFHIQIEDEQFHLQIEDNQRETTKSQHSLSG